ncbi:MAG: tetratricopeptide repeat protein [Xanthomonadales bacterium]|nr:tetratricopeptide repeat protein [Xanthomonadales bacterium]
MLVVTALAYINAAPDVLVFDDKEFLAKGQFTQLVPSDFATFFSQSLWEASGNTTKLYRPLLLVSLALESLAFGKWWTAYHLVNVSLHVLATLCVFGFVREASWRSGEDRERSHWAALMAALVFGVHPVLSDAVNSVFNGSEIYVTIGVVGGLWYLLRHQRHHPLRAWLVLSLVYLWALLYRESAVSLPALAVLMLWMTSQDGWMPRLKRCLPVLVLLLPLAIYLGMRSHALEPPSEAESATGPVTALQEPAGEAVGPAGSVPAQETEGVLARLDVRFDLARTSKAVVVWFDGLKLVVWPHPLVIIHEPSRTPFWLAAVPQLLLLSMALYALIRGRPLFFTGLVFFYLAILPSSRIVSENLMPPLLLERMLYLPSAGLALALAAGLGLLARKTSMRVMVVAATVLVLLLMPVTWARNQDWSDEIQLLENDFSVSEDSRQLLISLAKVHAKSGNLIRSVALCGQYAELVRSGAHIARECANIFVASGNYDRAEDLYLTSLDRLRSNAWTHFELARLYVRMDRREDAQPFFSEALQREKVPFVREIMSAIMLVELYPGDRSRLLEARRHLETALRLQPRSAQARQALSYVEQKL